MKLTKTCVQVGLGSERKPTGASCFPCMSYQCLPSGSPISNACITQSAWSSHRIVWAVHSDSEGEARQPTRANQELRQQSLISNPFFKRRNPAIASFGNHLQLPSGSRVWGALAEMRATDLQHSFFRMAAPGHDADMEGYGVPTFADPLMQRSRT